MNTFVLLLAANQLDARRYLKEWPALKSPALTTVTVRSLEAARGQSAGALFVTPAARHSPLFRAALDELALCFGEGPAFPPRSRNPRPPEIRRIGGGQAVRYQVPDPRGDGIRRAAELIRAGGPVGHVAAVLRDAATTWTSTLFKHLGPADQVGIGRLISMLPTAVEEAGQLVELPPEPKSLPDVLDVFVSRPYGRRMAR